MRQWLGDPLPPSGGPGTDVAREQGAWGGGSGVDRLSEEFRAVRAEQIALLPGFRAARSGVCHQILCGAA